MYIPITRASRERNITRKTIGNRAATSQGMIVYHARRSLVIVRAGLFNPEILHGKKRLAQLNLPAKNSDWTSKKTSSRRNRKIPAGSFRAVDCPSVASTEFSHN